jgi:hypothetical protein
VEYVLSESTLTARQQTEITITSVTGRSAAGRTTLFVPAAKQGWILNGSLPSEVALDPPMVCTLVSPERVDLTEPQAWYGPLRTSATVPLYVFVIHQAKRREENFLFRIVLRLSFAERLTTDLETPIVRAVDGERVILRLTNESRDGLGTWIQVSDSAVVSDTSQIRLSGKGVSVLDTLILKWSSIPPGGISLRRFVAEGHTLGRFAARAFPVTVDSGRRVAVATGLATSSTVEALRRLTFTDPRVCHDATAFVEALRDADVAVVDRRAIALVPGLALARDAVRSFAEHGGTVIVLPQDSESWVQAAWWSEVRLGPPDGAWRHGTVRVDSLAEAMSRPNALRAGEFDDWLFRQSRNSITVQQSPDVRVALRGGDGTPLLIERSVGGGRMIYLNLALPVQWQNIHPGSYRLLANLIARTTGEHSP